MTILTEQLLKDLINQFPETAKIARPASWDHLDTSTKRAVAVSKHWSESGRICFGFSGIEKDFDHVAHRCTELGFKVDFLPVRNQDVHILNYLIISVFCCYSVHSDF